MKMDKSQKMPEQAVLPLDVGQRVCHHHRPGTDEVKSGLNQDECSQRQADQLKQATVGGGNHVVQGNLCTHGQQQTDAFDHR